MRKVIALGVVCEAFRRNRLQYLLELIQVGGAGYFLQIGQAKDEIAESNLLGKNAAQILQQGRRTFAQK